VLRLVRAIPCFVCDRVDFKTQMVHLCSPSIVTSLLSKAKGCVRVQCMGNGTERGWEVKDV